jgi:rfaE bifunctional protein kinase chain/domain
MNPEINIEDFFKQVQGMRILVIGDAMLDTYIQGEVDRVSPEAPVPVVHVKQRVNRLGGAANVALNLKSLGAEPLLCTVIGDDPAADGLIERLREQDIRLDAVVRSRSRKTTVKTRVLCQRQQMIRIDEEEIEILNRADTAELMQRCRQIMGEGPIAAAIIQDYDKGLLHAENISDWLSSLEQQGIPICVDPKKENFWAYRNVRLFKPNLREIRDGLIDLEVQPEAESLDQAAEALQKRIANTYTLITLGAKGMFLSTPEESRIYPAHRREVADVSGAGDTVISMASLGIGAGLAPQLWANLANLAGGIVCESVGVVPIDRDRLRSEAERLFSELRSPERSTMPKP